ncbi:hypothetical protein ABZ726_26085 [Streptomyces hundungensis]|uniref:hypothetical protein n=1 Tax=Streptomyces hundungensis TaxID=1077946 RepID=UPI0033ED2EA3
MNGALGNVLPDTAQVLSIGDTNGDGYPDLVAKYNNNLWFYVGDPAAKPGVPAVKLGRTVALPRNWKHFGNRTLFGTGGWSLANRPLVASGDDADGNTVPDPWATTGDGKLLFYSGARDASGNPTNGASTVVGSSGWNAITAIS